MQLEKSLKATKTDLDAREDELNQEKRAKALLEANKKKVTCRDWTHCGVPVPPADSDKGGGGAGAPGRNRNRPALGRRCSLRKTLTSSRLSWTMAAWAARQPRRCAG